MSPKLSAVPLSRCFVRTVEKGKRRKLGQGDRSIDNMLVTEAQGAECDSQESTTKVRHGDMCTTGMLGSMAVNRYGVPTEKERRVHISIHEHEVQRANWDWCGLVKPESTPSNTPPNPSQRDPPNGNQAFKYVKLREPLSFKLAHHPPTTVDCALYILDKSSTTGHILHPLLNTFIPMPSCHYCPRKTCISLKELKVENQACIATITHSIQSLRG